MPQVVMPNQNQQNPLDIVRNALGIAESVYGIYTKKKDREALEQGIYNPSQTMEIEQKYTRVPKGTKGSVPATITNEMGQKEEVGYVLKAPGISAEKAREFDIRQGQIRNDRITSAQTRFNADKQIQDAVNKSAAADRVMQLIQSGNPVGYDAIKTQIPRLFGEVGNLTEAEQQRGGGNPALIAKARRFMQMQLTGTIPDSDRQLIGEIVQVFKNSNQNKAFDRAGLMASQASRQLGMSKDQVLNDVYAINELFPGVKYEAYADRNKHKPPQAPGGSTSVLPSAQAAEPFNPAKYILGK